jgi:nucleoid DNA-binding protein
MIKDKISSQEVIDLVSSKAQVSKRVSEDFLKVMISTIEESLLAGELVKIKNFGTFKLQWNEPRKSVNVHSGEDILLAGYYKVTFTPDVILKDLVNEPFAHLTPVELDSENPEPEQEKTNVALDPLRIFNDQASEIKDLLSEIQSLSPKEEVVVNTPVFVPTQVEPIHDETDYADYLLQKELVNKPIEQEPKEALPEEEEVAEQILGKEIVEVVAPVEGADYQNEEVSSISSLDAIEDVKLTPTKDVENNNNSAESPLPADNSDVEFDSTEFLKEIHPRRVRRFWIKALIVFLFLLVTFSGFYLFYPPVRNFTTSTALGLKSSVLKNSEKVSMTEMFNTVSSWFTPKQKPTPIPIRKVVIAPKDTTSNDSVAGKVAVKVDSLQLMFDKKRVYKTFIATETVKPNGRLTIMAKRYYGSKDFWVYIYEANKDRIPDPDRISEGTQIRIPKLDSRLIDPANPRCIKKARELHDLYVKKEN